MPDIATITAALSSIKTATDIARFLRSSDISLERAELKLKLADLVGALADTKIGLTDLQEILMEKERRIEELELAFQNKNLLVRKYDAYYEVDSKNTPIGIPFCLRCWESDHRKKQLVAFPKDRSIHICTSCGQQYERRRTEVLAPAEES